ncbi:MAG: hypothetical protein J6T10_02575 [Methanobrevibacter sp.]|nr:hypothetical protein [Methanobrevibacter sp.]
MIYRIYIEVGYRKIALDFKSSQEAGDFASTLLSHINTGAGENKSKLSFEVINPEAIDEDEEDE